jgi:signal peptidase I
MKKSKRTFTADDLPETKVIEDELNRVRYQKQYGGVIRSTVYILVTVAAVAVLISSLLLPTFRIYGSSMSPTLEEGTVVVSIKTSKMDNGDLVAFYFNNKLLVKRVIASGGEWVNIDEDGNVYVNDVLLEEPYVSEKSLASCDIELPYQVPDGRVFVMGDHRSVSLDSRMQDIGCIAQDQVAGKLKFVLWPFSKFGSIK